MRKRIISMMLVICMVLMYVPTTALAEGTERAGGTYTKIEGTSGANDNEGPEKLLDGNDGTKWCVTNFSNAYIIFKTSSPVDVSGYSITTGGDNFSYHGRNPESWKLYGMKSESNPNRSSESWTEIHSVTNDTVLQDENNTTYNYVFDKTGTAYNYFKLEISAIKGGDVMQMSEFKLTSCEHKWDESKTTTKENTCINAGFISKTCSNCNFEYINYQAKLGHSFTGEGGKCIRCNKTNEEVHTFNILNSNGSKNQKYCENEVKESDTNWSGSTSSGTTENSGWYVVNSDVTIDGRVTVNGDVHLILADDCTLTVKGGINVNDSNSLTIYSESMGDKMGKLIVEGVAGNNAGIGGNTTTKEGGNVTINGGVVTVKSTNGAGIGGGYSVSTNQATGEASSTGTGGNGGTVTINGGVVTATSSNGAGIGGGGGDTNYATGGNGGNVTINGGVVTATSKKGAGIGGGDGQSKGGAGSLTIRNGNAVVFASEIADQTQKNNWQGIVFEGSNAGKIYGTSVTPINDFTIERGKTLQIESGKNLTILNGVTLTNNGTIENSGTLTNNGTIAIKENGKLNSNTDFISNSGEIYVDGVFSSTNTVNNIYYPLTLKEASASGDTSNYNSKTYAKAGSKITLTPITSAGQAFRQWVVSTSSVSIQNNEFTMPNSAFGVIAEFGPIIYYDPTESFTSPVSDGNAIEIKASIRDGVAKVSEITTETIDKMLDNASSNGETKVDTIKIDLSGAKQEVKAIILSKKTLETLANAIASEDNDIDTVTIVLSKASVVLDSKTLETVVKEAKGNDIKLVINDKKISKLNTSQQNAIKKYHVATLFEAIFESNGKAIHDFNGGTATVTINFEPEEGKNMDYYHMVHISDDGVMTRYKTRYTKGKLIFTTPHFSDYAAIYDESEKNQTAIERPVPVTGIDATVDKTTLTKKGAIATIKVTVQPEDATNKNVTYTSSNTKVAKVDKNGKVTAVANGKTTIIIKTVDGAFTKKIVITVKIPDPMPTKAQIASNSVVLNSNATAKWTKENYIKLTWGKVTGAAGYEVYVRKCDGKSLWTKPAYTAKSGNASYVTLKKLGGKKFSTTANYKYGVRAYKYVNGKKVYFGTSLTYHFVGSKNKKETNAKSVTAGRKTITLGVKKTTKLTSIVSKVNKRCKLVKHDALVRYISSNPSVAKVDLRTGKVTGVKAGKCKIYCIALNGVMTTVSVTVK